MRSASLILCWVCSVLVAAVALPVRAQATRPGASPPATAEQMLNEMLSPTTRSETISSRPSERTTSVQPQGHIQYTGGPRVLREGSELVERAGHLRKRTDSTYQEFVFDNQDGESPLAPMLVLPDLKLMSMEDAVTATKPNLRFTVSGTVTEYKGSNYILLQSGPDDLGQSMSPAPVSAQSASTRPASADDLLSEMLKTSGGARGRPSPNRTPTKTADLSTGPGAVAPAAPLMNVLRERSEIVDRTARLTRSADGRQLELTFEADGTAMQDPPLIILPNLKLSAMENAAAVNNREPKFRVTGMVTEYRGRNCILLEKVVVLPEINQQF